MTASKIIRRLLGLQDVDADGIEDGETLVWDAATESFVPGPVGGGGGGGSISVSGGATTVDPASSILFEEGQSAELVVADFGSGQAVVSYGFNTESTQFVHSQAGPPSPLSTFLGPFVYATTAGTLYGWDGNGYVVVDSPSTGAVTYRKVTPKTVAGTTTETDLLNGEITLAAGVLGTTKVAKIVMWGDWKNNSGGSAGGPQLKFKLGGTTVFDTDVLGSFIAGYADSASRWGWNIEVIVAAANATGAQTVSIVGRLIGQENPIGTNPAVGGTAFLTGEGKQMVTAGRANGTDAQLAQIVGYASAAKDSTAALTVQLTTINASASANYDVVLAGALVEVV